MKRAGNPNPATARLVHYDGGCALCHGFVRFVIAYGPPDIKFAPINGQRTGTIVVRLDDGCELYRSDAVIAILRRCRPFWRTLARILEFIPRPIRDFGYNVVAAIRYRIFGRPKDVCPILPPELRSRILDSPQAFNTPGNLPGEKS